MTFKDLVFDTNDKSVRGSFINGLITVSILGVTIYGLLFSDVIVARVEKLAMFIIGFFTSSYGIWSLKKHMDDRNNTEENIANIQQGNVLPQTIQFPGQPVQPAVYKAPPAVPSPPGPQPGTPENPLVFDASKVLIT